MSTRSEKKLANKIRRDELALELLAAMQVHYNITGNGVAAIDKGAALAAQRIKEKPQEAQMIREVWAGLIREFKTLSKKMEEEKRNDLHNQNRLDPEPG